MFDLSWFDSLIDESSLSFTIITAIGVLGDLADTLGSIAGSLIQQFSSSREFLNECLTSDNHMIKKYAMSAKLLSIVLYLFEVRLSYSISFIINYLHAFGFVEAGRGIACVKLSPWSDSKRYLFQGLQVITNSCIIISNASLTFALSPLSPIL